MPTANCFTYSICSKRKKPHALYALLISFRSLGARPNIFPVARFQHFVIYDWGIKKIIDRSNGSWENGQYSKLDIEQMEIEKAVVNTGDISSKTNTCSHF